MVKAIEEVAEVEEVVGTESYKFQVFGVTPILKHRDDVLACDEVTAWRKHPDNKKFSVKGDDRWPAWTWQTYLYVGDDGNLVVPSANLMVSLRHAATKITLKGTSTFKQLSQSAIHIQDENLLLLNHGKPIPIKPILAVRNKPFVEHVAVAQSLGFDLFIKRPRVGKAKHVRVRPKFTKWSLSGSLIVTEPQSVTEEILREMFSLAGRISGLCDWRPSSPESPGPYGLFRTVVKKVESL